MNTPDDDSSAPNIPAFAELSQQLEGPLGVDLVHIPSFGHDLNRPGTSFLKSAFTVGERMVAKRRRFDIEPPNVCDPAIRHFAGRWAAKEAVVKAWSQALYGTPPPIARDEMNWQEIEIVPDAWGRVAVKLHGRVAQAVAETLGTGDSTSAHAFHVSISHDGDYAVAVVMVLQ